MMVDMVLGTEMVVHFEVVALFKSKLGDGGLNFATPEDRKLVMKMLVHVADISNPSRNTELAGKWTEAVMAEFFAQGDSEKEKGLSVSPFMDRVTTSTPKCQLGFIDFIVAPLHATWGDFLKQETLMTPERAEIAQMLVDNIAANKAFWTEKQQAENAAAAVPAPTSPTLGDGESK